MDDRLRQLIEGIAASGVAIARCIVEREHLGALYARLQDAEPTQECFAMIAEVCDLARQNDAHEREARDHCAFFQRKMALYA